MFVHTSDEIVDVYPFVDSEKQLPSARVTACRGQVSYNGQIFTKEDVAKLTAAFKKAFDVIEKG